MSLGASKGTLCAPNMLLRNRRWTRRFHHTRGCHSGKIRIIQVERCLSLAYWPDMVSELPSSSGGREPVTKEPGKESDTSVASSGSLTLSEVANIWKQ